MSNTESKNRPSIARRLAHRFHLWLGITVGFYILVMSLSGTTLVFADELMGLSRPVVSPTGQSKRCSIDFAFDNVQKKFQKYVIKHIHLPESKTSPFEFYLYADNERLVELVNPQTGLPMGQRNPLIQWVMNLHFDLLNGEFGRNLNGIGALFLFSILLTGLVIWWQGLHRVKQRLSIDLKANWKRINWDIHTAISVFAVPFVLIWATSGFYFGFPDTFKMGLAYVFPLDKAKKKSIIVAKDSNRQLENNLDSIDDLVASVEAQEPDLQARWIKLTPGGKKVTRVRLGASGNSDKSKLVAVNFAGDSNQIKSIVRPEDQQNSQLFIDLIKKLHFGTIFGVYSKIAWVVIGLMPALLFSTGFLIWFNKFRARKSNASLYSKANEIE